MQVDKVKVYGFHESIAASKYPKSINVNECNADMTATVRNLGNAEPGSGHDNFLNGIVVQFDLTCSVKMWVEAERYHFLEFVSSQSTMHCITKFDPEKQCNPFVDRRAIEALKEKIEEYNASPCSENYLAVLYNVPVGFELTARMSTNYRQLKTIYGQRKNHRLNEWKRFCRWIETLPGFKELCLEGKKDD